MIDPEFLAELQRAPEPLLAEYELSDAERATVQQALARLAKTPSSQRRHEFRSSLIPLPPRACRPPPKHSRSCTTFVCSRPFPIRISRP
jgi:hypothetical protein